MASEEAAAFAIADEARRQAPMTVVDRALNSHDAVPEQSSSMISLNVQTTRSKQHYGTPHYRNLVG